MSDLIHPDYIVIENNQAWLVVEDKNIFRGLELYSSVSFVSDLDRPCDACGGKKGRQILRPSPGPSSLVYDWAACDCINGRHTFDIEVKCPVCADLSDLIQLPPEHPVLCYRASVIPGMILPIVEYECPIETHIAWGEASYYYCIGRTSEEEGHPITLPPAAAPGMFAIQLNVSKV